MLVPADEALAWVERNVQEPRPISAMAAPVHGAIDRRGGRPLGAVMAELEESGSRGA